MKDILAFVIFGGDAFGTVIEVLLFVFLVFFLIYIIRWFMNRS